MMAYAAFVAKSVALVIPAETALFHVDLPAPISVVDQRAESMIVDTPRVIEIIDTKAELMITKPAGTMKVDL